MNFFLKQQLVFFSLSLFRGVQVVALRSNGENCTSDSHCESNFCVYPTGNVSGPKYCKGHQEIGSSCETDWDCFNYGCTTTGFCAGPTVGDPCDNSERCLSGECSDDGYCTARSGRTGGCFSADSRTHVYGKGRVLVKDLRVGDKVLVAPGKYETVYSFAHYELKKEHEFIRIFTGGESPLEVTKEHLLFVQNETTRAATAIAAEEVRVGDSLLVVHDSGEGSGGFILPAVVRRIDKINRRGRFAPLTPSGKIVVNEVSVSTNVSLKDYLPKTILDRLYFYLPFLNHHHLFQYWLSPYRILCLGVSESFGGNPEDYIKHNEGGVLAWLLVGKQVAELADGFPFILQFVLFGIPLFLVFGILNLLEFLFGPSSAVIALVLVAALLVRRCRSKAGESAELLKRKTT